MTPIRLAAAVLATAVLAACGTSMSNTPPAGYLSSYSGLQTTDQNSSAGIRSAVALDPGRIEVVDVQWRAQPEAGLQPAEQSALQLKLRNDLLQEVRKLPNRGVGQAAHLRAAITRVETVSPLLNTLGTALLIGPLDRGGVAVEIEAIDPATGRQLAALRFGYYAPLSDFAARFSRLAPAEIAVQRAAVDFARLLAPEAPVKTGAL